jgi:hypothetical protein
LLRQGGRFQDVQSGQTADNFHGFQADGDDPAKQRERIGRVANGLVGVFLTGGTSFVPAVRQIFTARFGMDRISAGGELVSVVEGLALIGRDRLAAAL